MSLVLSLGLAVKLAALTVLALGRPDLSFRPSNVRWWPSRDGKVTLELKVKLDPIQKDERRWRRITEKLRSELV